jgi:hypothetical protein
MKFIYRPQSSQKVNRIDSGIYSGITNEEVADWRLTRLLSIGRRKKRRRGET